jgi:membrane-bound serine protease (ClpP class)
MALVAGLMLVLLTCLAARSPAQTAAREVLLLTVTEAITPATMDYLQRGIASAEARGGELVVIQLDTPGGLMTSTRDLIKTILAAEVPVATFVAPSGARAASAGAYILLASHVAAMAPATHVGSATPVQMGGLPALPSDEGSRPEPDPGAAPTPDSATAMERKVLEDAVSYIRELADRHGRNAAWAERAVRDAANLGAQEALAEKVIDLIAADVDALLASVDGRRVNLASGERTLHTRDAAIVRVDPDWRTRLLSVITDPNVAYFLLILGFYGIVFEFANPGALVPGVVGATCLLLALFAFQILAVDYAGLALILLGLAFIVAEAFVPSFGVLGLGGLVAFVAGSVILMDGSHRDVSLPAVGGVGAIAAGFLLWMVTRLVTLRRRRPVYGVEHVTEEPARASEDFTPRDGRYCGFVRMNGERWRAESDVPVAAGDCLRVLGVDGLTVKVTATGHR